MTLAATPRRALSLFDATSTVSPLRALSAALGDRIPQRADCALDHLSGDTHTLCSVRVLWSAAHDFIAVRTSWMGASLVFRGPGILAARSRLGTLALTARRNDICV